MPFCLSPILFSHDLYLLSELYFNVVEKPPGQTWREHWTRMREAAASRRVISHKPWTGIPPAAGLPIQIQ
jgi:hypothetical protein